MPGKRLMSCWKDTLQNWYGNYTLNDNSSVQSRLVRVSLYQDEVNLFRICVWGDDDFGLEKEYQIEEESVFNFHKILAMENVGQGDLRDMGFVPA